MLSSGPDSKEADDLRGGRSFSFILETLHAMQMIPYAAATGSQPLAYRRIKSKQQFPEP